MPSAPGNYAFFVLPVACQILWYDTLMDTSLPEFPTVPRRETLVALLRERGVGYLAPSDAAATEQIDSDEALLLALLRQPDARLRLALIPLLLRQPGLAAQVATLADQLDLETALDLQTLYMAAVYLQRLWKTRLGFYLDVSLLPDLFSQQMGLPPADERFGKNGLHDLAERWRARSPYPFNRLASLNNVMDLFFEQLKIEQASAISKNPIAPKR